MSFWRGLFFDFFQDDNLFIWNGLYHPFAQIFTFRHPGTPLEAFLLSHLFGLHLFFYELVGLALKICTAYLAGVFLYKITNSKLTWFLASIFLAVSYTGMYAMNSFSFNVPALAAIPILLSLIYLVGSLKENKYDIWKFVVFLMIGIVLDPARVLPTFCLIPFFLFLFRKSKNLTFIIAFLKKLLIVFLAIGLPIIAIWYIKSTTGGASMPEVFIRGMFSNPKFMITKIKDIGNYFATIANVFTDIVYGLSPIAPKYEVSIYASVFGLAGFGIFIGGLVSFIYFLKKKSQTSIIIALLVFWAYIFYLPNYLQEPRAPMTSIHHYLFISSIGSVGLFAYLISLIKKKWVLVSLSILFIMLNIYKANTLLFLQSLYRQSSYIENSWHIISSGVPRNEKGDIFLFKGYRFWIDNSIYSYGAFHFLMLRKNPNASEYPQLTYDENFIIGKLCTKQISIAHVYAFEATTPGKLINITNLERMKLEGELIKKDCQFRE